MQPSLLSKQVIALTGAETFTSANLYLWNTTQSNTTATFILHSLIRRLYEFASSLFEERVQQMREDKLNGIICRYIDTGCYVEDPHKSIAASVKKLNPVASKDEL